MCVQLWFIVRLLPTFNQSARQALRLYKLDLSDLLQPQERRNNAVLLPLAHSAQRQVHTSVLFGLDVCFDQTLNRLRVSASASQKPNTAYTVSTPTCSHGLFGHWSMNKGRTSSTALVKGSQSDIDLTNAGS